MNMGLFSVTVFCSWAADETVLPPEVLTQPGWGSARAL